MPYVGKLLSYNLHPFGASCWKAECWPYLLNRTWQSGVGKDEQDNGPICFVLIGSLVYESAKNLLNWSITVRTGQDIYIEK